MNLPAGSQLKNKTNNAPAVGNIATGTEETSQSKVIGGKVEDVKGKSKVKTEEQRKKEAKEQEEKSRAGREKAEREREERRRAEEQKEKERLRREKEELARLQAEFKVSRRVIRFGSGRAYVKYICRTRFLKPPPSRNSTLFVPPSWNRSRRSTSSRRRTA